MDIDTLAGGVDGVAHCCKDGRTLMSLVESKRSSMVPLLRKRLRARARARTLYARRSNHAHDIVVHPFGRDAFVVAISTRRHVGLVSCVVPRLRSTIMRTCQVSWPRDTKPIARNIIISAFVARQQ